MDNIIFYKLVTNHIVMLYRKHGKTLEEGASGYLAKKICANNNGEGLTINSMVEWKSFNKLFSDHPSKEDIAFGSKQWASVYLASTPQQAAAMGLEFPGVDEVLVFVEILSFLSNHGLF